MPKRKKTNNRDVSGIINIFLYAILVLIAIFWNFISAFLPDIKIETLLAILIGILLVSEIFTNNTLEKIQKKLTSFENNELVFSEDLTQSLVKSLEGRNQIEKLRIFALSTTVIQPVIRGSLKCKINECSLLIRSLNDQEYSDNFGNAVRALLRMWDDMVTEKKITKLEKNYFDDLPSEYNIIIDDELLIIGSYIFTEVDASHVSIGKVFTLSNERKAGQDIIDAYISRFDKSVAYFNRKNNGCIQQEI